MFGMADPEADKKRLVKQIGKDLATSRYRFYKPKTSEALPGLARFFYETYKMIAPAQVLLDQRGAERRAQVLRHRELPLQGAARIFGAADRRVHPGKGQDR